MKIIVPVTEVGASASNRGSVLPRLVSLILLTIITTAALTSAHSEASQHPKSSSPTSTPSISTIQFEGFPSLPVRGLVVGSDQTNSGLLGNSVDQHLEHRNLEQNNANSHVAPMQENDRQKLQQQETSHPKTNDAANQFLHPKLDSRGSTDLSTGEPSLVEANSEEPINSETNLADLDQQSRASPHATVTENAGAQLQEMAKGGADSIEVFATDSARESESLHEGEHRLIERRFGLFKKGHQTNNNNLPYSNLASISLYNDYCDRCFSSGSSNSNGLVWKVEPTMRQQHQQQQQQQQQSYPIYPLAAHNEAPVTHQFGSFKSKLSKFHFSKPLKSDSFFGHNHQNGNIYRTPISSRMPYRAQHPFMQNQHFNCMIPTPMANSGGSILGASIANQGSMDDPKVSQHLSYSNIAPY